MHLKSVYCELGQRIGQVYFDFFFGFRIGLCGRYREFMEVNENY